LDYHVKKDQENGQTNYSVKLTNKTNKLAFFNRLKLVDSKNGNLVSPAFYSDNYFSLLPGESKEVTIEYPARNTDCQVVLQGFNVEEIKLNE